MSAPSAVSALYRPELFEPLTDAPWDNGQVRGAIRAIVEDVERAFRGPNRMWSPDPMPKQAGWHPPDPMTSLYEGAAGTLYAVEELQRRGFGETGLNLVSLSLQALELYAAAPDFGESTEPVPEPRDAALLTGETGLLLLAWRLAPSAEIADRLERRILMNLANEANEVMWGVPGTLLAAATMLHLTGEVRWRDAVRQSREALLLRRDADGLWTQHLYGEVLRRLDPIHGTSGVILVLARSVRDEAVDDKALEELEIGAATTFRRLAVIEDGLANWPLVAESSPGLLRWCAGAPGVVFATAGYLDEDLLLAGGELIWRAGGPRMSSGPGICCGTSGNGYALLKIFDRTGDEMWLDRARAFAVHALAQVRRDRDRGGPGWYSLWKGDPGVALFAADCLEGRARYPLFDGF